MFERTRSGQQNRALFYGVDYVCYVEGGGGVQETAPDITFWTSTLAYFKPELKFKVLPRGGKTVLQTLAEEVIKQDIAKTLIAMDRDYDDLRSRIIADHRVFYTYGYSWENDAFNIDNLESVYCALSHCGPIPQEPRAQLQQCLNTLEAALANAVKADFFALCAGTSVLPRRSPGRVIALHADTNLPIVAKNQVLELTRAANNGPKRKNISEHSGPPTDTIRHCVGKIYAYAMRLAVKAVIQANHAKNKLSEEHFRDVALLTFPSFLARRPEHPISQHYHGQLAAL